MSDWHFTAIFTDRCLMSIWKVYGDVAECKQVVALGACVLIAIAIALADKRRCAQVLFHRLMWWWWRWWGRPFRLCVAPRVLLRGRSGTTVQGGARAQDRLRPDK